MRSEREYKKIRRRVSEIGGIRTPGRGETTCDERDRKVRNEYKNQFLANIACGERRREIDAMMMIVYNIYTESGFLSSEKRHT